MNNDKRKLGGREGDAEAIVAVEDDTDAFMGGLFLGGLLAASCCFALQMLITFGSSAAVSLHVPRPTLSVVSVGDWPS